MPSPVTAADFTLQTQLVGVCEKLTYLLGVAVKTGEFVGNLYDEDGNPTQELLSLGQPPPGVVVAWWTTTSDFSTAKTEVEKLGRTAADITAGNAPFWRVADGTNGTPDLRGRTILGVQNVGSETSTARGVNSQGGAEKSILPSGSIPDHNHRLGAFGITAGITNNDLLFRNISAVDVDSFSGKLLSTDNDGEAATSATKENIISGGVHSAISDPDAEPDPVDIMPPFHVLYWIIRTTRTA